MKMTQRKSNKGNKTSEAMSMEDVDTARNFAMNATVSVASRDKRDYS